MASKLLECLTVDGNYSKARIGALLLAIFSLAYFIWLIVLTVSMSQINCEEKSNSSDSTDWNIITVTQPMCSHPNLDIQVKDKVECAKKANETNAIFMWFGKSGTEGKKSCQLFKTCPISESKFSKFANGTTFMKGADDKYDIIVGKMDRKRCVEKGDKLISSEEDYFYKECLENAIKSDEAKFMMYAEAFSLKLDNGTAVNHPSLCELYKECELKTFNDPDDTKSPPFVQPFKIYKRPE